jgi:hypothetical protein
MEVRTERTPVDVVFGLGVALEASEDGRSNAAFLKIPLPLLHASHSGFRFDFDKAVCVGATAALP